MFGLFKASPQSIGCSSLGSTIILAEIDLLVEEVFGSTSQMDEMSLNIVITWIAKKIDLMRSECTQEGKSIVNLQESTEYRYYVNQLCKYAKCSLSSCPYCFEMDLEQCCACKTYSVMKYLLDHGIVFKSDIHEKAPIKGANKEYSIFGQEFALLAN